MGGVFTSADGRWAVLRDNDVLEEVTRLDEDPSGRMGFVGSDKLGELPDSRRQRVEDIGVAATGMRFALMARRERVEQVEEMIASQETLGIVTSYPRQAREFVDVIGGSALRILATPGGSVETAWVIRKKAHAIVDIVDTGETADKNGYEIIIDGLRPVTINAVWKNESDGVIEDEIGSDFDYATLTEAIEAIEKRVREAIDGQRGSYTQLLASDINKLVKKYGEEMTEALKAFLEGSAAELESETADVMYVLTILNTLLGTSMKKALGKLAARNSH